MTLRDLTYDMAGGTYLHIGAAHGDGWLYSDTCLNLTSLEKYDDLDKYMDREIVVLYYFEGREYIPGYCCKMEPGIAVQIEGYENGGI